MNELKTELHKLYSDTSKHSVYQNIPDFVTAELGYAETIDESWRGDRPRLAYLLESRKPAAGENWMDFGANTGFFILSLAKMFPKTIFTAVEANPNHAHFIKRVAQYFAMDNVKVLDRAIGLNDLDELPKSDFLLHLNVLHHAGHDFDQSLVLSKAAFGSYALQYLTKLRERTSAMIFQMGSNWGGDKKQPLIAVHDDLDKLRIFSEWLRNAHWDLSAIAYPRHDGNGRVIYSNIPGIMREELNHRAELSNVVRDVFDASQLDSFPGEFYRRPLFLCQI